MEKQDGIALISTLLIMAAIMALGVSTLFLSNMNLRIAENSRTSALARFNAEAGLDAAIVQLNKESKATKQFPEKTSFVLPTSPNSDMTYQLISYDPYSDVSGLRIRARVVILGTSPNNGRYQTEALLEATTLANEVDPTFPVGLVSEDHVSVNGGPTMKDAPLHGNKGYTIASSVTFQQNCDANGNNCATTNSGDRPVSAAKNPKSPPEPEWTYTCSASGQDGNVLCPSGKPWKYKEKPVSLKEVGTIYNKIRNGDDKTSSRFGVSSANTLTGTSPTGCTHTVSSLATTYTEGSKVCVTGNVTLPSGANYSGVTIIVKGSVTIPSAATLTNTNLLSMGTINQNGLLTMAGSRLFSDSKMTINSSIAYSGNSTIASGTDLEVASQGGAIYNTQSTEVGMAMMAVGNLTAQGLKGNGTDYANAAVWAGGTASLNGGAKLRGGIGAGGRLEIKGTNEIYGRAIFVNPDLPLSETSIGSLGRR